MVFVLSQQLRLCWGFLQKIYCETILDNIYTRKNLDWCNFVIWRKKKIFPLIKKKDLALLKKRCKNKNINVINVSLPYIRKRSVILLNCINLRFTAVCFEFIEKLFKNVFKYQFNCNIIIFSEKYCQDMIK